jgi:hypothetical protein
MLTIILCWLVLGTAIGLIGRLVLNRKLLGFLNIKETFEWYEYFWVGLVAVITVLQIWSLFLPVNIYALLFVFILAGISLLFSVRGGITLQKFDFKFLAYAGLILLFISYFASLSLGWGDTYLYHLNAVKWSNLYPTVPGLANLHSRLGQTSSLFVFASMIGNWILKDRSSHIALSLLASVLSLQFLWLFLRSNERIIKIFSLLVIPLFSIGVARTTLVVSLTADFALLIIALAACLEVVKGKRGPLLVAGLLAVLMVTIKLSGALFAALVLIFVVLRTKGKPATIFLITAGALVFFPFIIRNIVLSGWPLYPLPMFGFNVPWAVPKNAVIEAYTVIKAWAISPGPEWNKSIGLTFWQWFPGWYAANSWAIEMKMLFFGAFLFLIAPLTKMITPGFFGKYRNLLFLGAASLLSMFYILFTAPDFRFGQVFFWIFFGVVATCYIDAILNKVPNLRVLFVFLGAFFTFAIMWPIRIDGGPVWRTIRWEASFPVEKIMAIPSDGSPSFEIYKPTDKGFCGNSELPCTPEDSTKFKEIVPGDVSKGFAPVN